MNAIADMTATRTAVRDEPHAGHIHGAFGTIRQSDHGPLGSRVAQLLAHALGELPRPRLSIAVKTWMVVLRAYLVLAAGLVLLRIVTLA